MSQASPLADALQDRYVLERELGRGGMATVYLARDLRHERLVALKVLHSDLAATLGPDRFLREIKLAAGLQHPHIVPVFDSGQAAGQLWYAMPAIEGESLRDRLRRAGRLPTEDALQIARETALALDYAHRHGIVHRDIKPENILISDGQALVTDFGVARALATATDDRLTGTGFAVGTAQYMSPEQASGDDVDGRSDIYALGCVLYEMICGEPLYQGDTLRAVIAQHFMPDPQRLSRLNKLAPYSVQVAIHKALALKPEDRFGTASSFAEAVAPTASSTPAVIAGFLFKQLPWKRITAAAIGILIVSGVLYWRTRSEQPPQLLAIRAPTIAVLPFTSSLNATDRYIADGIADEVRGRLTKLPGLSVIASASAGRYRDSNKEPTQIGRELGAHYLLGGRIAKPQGVDTRDRIRISPELVQVAGVSVPTTLWQGTFDTTMADVASIQGAIASNVADALSLKLGESDRQNVSVAVRRDPRAYEAYLKGQEIMRQGASGPADLQRAIEYFRRAISLDSSFASAWAQLGWAQAVFSRNAPSGSEELLDQAKVAGARALRLGGAEAEARQVLAMASLFEGDRATAHQETILGLQADPSNARLTGYMASFLELEGRWSEALVYRRKAVALDPAAAGHAAGLATTLLWLRRHAEARAAADRYLILGPSNPEAYQLRAMVAVGEGKLPEARAVLRRGEGRVPKDELLAFVAYYWDLFWVLDPEQQARLLQLKPDAFYGDTLWWRIARAGTHLFNGDSAQAAGIAEPAYRKLKVLFAQDSTSAEYATRLGLVSAFLGHQDEAVEAAQTSLALLPLATDALNGALMVYRLACVQALVGRKEDAVATLETLLSIPFYVSPAWLTIDPNFASLRGDSGFIRLTSNSH